MSVQTTADTQLIANFVDLFSRYLCSQPKSIPHRWKASLHHDLAAPEDSTPRVFLKRGGAKAWLAYRAVKPTSAHRTGQEAQRRLFVQLDNLSTETRGDLAEMISTTATTGTSPKVDEYIRVVETEASSVAVTEPIPACETQRQSAAVQVDAPPPPKRRRIEGNPRRPSASLVTPPYSTLSASPYPEVGLPTDGKQEEEEGDVVTGAHVQGLADLVPPYLSGAIRRDENNSRRTAAVTMNFPARRLDDDTPCAITFAILDNKVEYVAEKLYDAHLEREGSRRFLYYNGSARKARIGPGLTLTCCTAEAIPELFGPLLAAGNLASPHRLHEGEDGLRITQTVTMSEFHEVGMGALITMSLGITAGTQIHEKLYSSR